MPTSEAILDELRDWLNDFRASKAVTQWSIDSGLALHLCLSSVPERPAKSKLRDAFYITSVAVAREKALWEPAYEMVKGALEVEEPGLASELIERMRQPL